MDRSELLPCPFCGADAADFGNTNYGTYFVNCGDCCVHTGGALLDDKRTKADAAQDWNARSPHWRPIESAPKRGFILVTDGQDQWVAWWSCGTWAYASERCGSDIEVGTLITHWMPLPALPAPCERGLSDES